MAVPSIVQGDSRIYTPNSSAWSFNNRVKQTEGNKKIEKELGELLQGGIANLAGDLKRILEVVGKVQELYKVEQVVEGTTNPKYILSEYMQDSRLNIARNCR